MQYLFNHNIPFDPFQNRIRSERRVKGIIPHLPDVEERAQIKEEYMKKYPKNSPWSMYNLCWYHYLDHSSKYIAHIFDLLDLSITFNCQTCLCRHVHNSPKNIRFAQFLFRIILSNTSPVHPAQI